MSYNEFPQFPKDIPTHPLLIIDFDLIQQGNEIEIDRLWEASTKLGFWYLKNHGSDVEVRGMFNMGAETMALPLEEKLKFEQGNEGMSFGYKSPGANAVDSTGKKDAVEFINVSKDDALAWPRQIHRSYPSTVNAGMESTIIPFIHKSVRINNVLLNVLNDRLGLPAGMLLSKHRDDETSGSESRVTRTPPSEKPKADDPTLGSHTDFGSLSFLHNRLGGLQVLVPETESWQYVRPIEGHAICNIGDALAIFSGGILRSSLHRVVSPPGYQAAMERWSLVFFTRPGNSVVLQALSDKSPLIEEAARKNASEKNVDFNTGVTSAEWFARRIKYQRIDNRKGPETWMASRGTEEVPGVA